MYDQTSDGFVFPRCFQALELYGAPRSRPAVAYGTGKRGLIHQVRSSSVAERLFPGSPSYGNVIGERFRY